MNKVNIWLRWALCAFGLGLVVSLSAVVVAKAAMGGWIGSPSAVWWGLMVGLVYSWLCPAAGIVLATIGLMMVTRRKGRLE